jgi:hypothetical protein
MPKRCPCAFVFLAVLLQTATLSAQQLLEPDAQPGEMVATDQPLPPVAIEPPRPEPVECGVPQYNLAGQVQASPAEMPQQPAAVEAAPALKELEPPPSTLNEAEISAAQAVQLAPGAEPVRASGLRDFWGYRYNQGGIEWIIGNGDQFGMFSWDGGHYQQSGVESGLGVGMDFHWVSGPARTEMPPRLFDFSLAYQCRQQYGPFAYDVAASVMASSDFEGSARRGIRYPAHAVGFLQVCPTAQLVFGVDYLDRGDIKLLPVAGLIWVPRDDVRLEFVFPRPRATFVLPPCGWCKGGTFADGAAQGVMLHSEEHRLYIAGDLGGGTWAVERERMYDDLATYRDLRLCIGLECVDARGARSAIEVGYLFARRLEFTSASGDMPLDDTAMIRWMCSY